MYIKALSFVLLPVIFQRKMLVIQLVHNLYATQNTLEWNQCTNNASIIPLIQHIRIYAHLHFHLLFSFADYTSLPFFTYVHWFIKAFSFIHTKSHNQARKCNFAKAESLESLQEQCQRKCKNSPKHSKKKGFWHSLGGYSCNIFLSRLLCEIVIFV